MPPKAKQIICLFWINKLLSTAIRLDVYLHMQVSAKIMWTWVHMLRKTFKRRYLQFASSIIRTIWKTSDLKLKPIYQSSPHRQLKKVKRGALLHSRKPGLSSSCPPSPSPTPSRSRGLAERKEAKGWQHHPNDGGHLPALHKQTKSARLGSVSRQLFLVMGTNTPFTGCPEKHICPECVPSILEPTESQTLGPRLLIS